MYANKVHIAEMFDISYSTVKKREKEIREEIGKRYNQYAIIGKLINVAVFADYEKYRGMLADKNLRKYVPEFDIYEAGRYLEQVQRKQMQQGYEERKIV